VAQREADLEAASFVRITPKAKAADAATGRVEKEEDDEEEPATALTNSTDTKTTGADVVVEEVVAASVGYEYLLRVTTLACTTEHAKRLRAQAERLQEQLEQLQRTLPVDMWWGDLDDFEEGLAQFEARKHEALEKKVKNRVKPPQRRHKNDILAERRAKNKVARRNDEVNAKAAHKALQEKQEKRRLAREVKRRVVMHQSPSAKILLQKLQDEGVITPTKPAPPRDNKGDPLFEAALSAAGMCVYVRMCMIMCVGVGVGVYVCMYGVHTGRAHVCVFVCICAYVCVCLRLYINTYICV